MTLAFRGFNSFPPSFGAALPPGLGKIVSQHDFTRTASLPAWASFARADGSTIAKYFNSSGVLTTVASAGAARYDYDPSTLSAQGLLLEPAFTELFLQTGFASGWVTTRATLTAGAATGIDGTASAATLIEDSTAANTHSTRQTVSTTAGRTYTQNVVAKKKGRNWIALQYQAAQFGTLLIAYFDLNAGVKGSVTAGATSNMKDLGGGFYRCSITATATVSTSAVWQLWLATADGTTSYDGDGASGVYLNLPNAGEAAYPLSIVSAAAGTVTRAADILTMTGFASSLIMTEEQSLATGFVSYQRYAGSSAFNTAMSGPGIRLRKVWIFG